MRLDPTVMLGEATNVVDGFARRLGRGPTHMWMSDPAQPLPQEITLRWPQPRRIAEVTVTFDNLERTHDQNPWDCHKRAGEMLARDYEILIRCDGQWRRVVCEEGNYHRFRRHAIEPATADAVRLRVLACHGDCRGARVYQIRVSDRQGNR